MHPMIPVAAAVGLLLGFGVPAAAEVSLASASAADAAALSVMDAATAQGQGQGRGQGQPESRGQGQARGKGQPESRGQGQARGQGQPESRGQGQARGAGQPQGRGEAQGRAQGQGATGERGRSGAAPGRSAAAPGRSSQRLSAEEVRARVAELPQPLRQLAGSDRRSERMAVGAIARGKARGLDADGLDVRSQNGTLRILNRSGTPLLELDERRARDLGEWRVRRLGDQRPNDNAPAFCRSGEGHPVWGVDWCLDKGFGLGSRDGTIWSRGRIDDVIFGRTDRRDRLDRGGLVDVLGDIVFGRLALHAVSLGYAEPLTGVWVGEPDGPRVLRVRSGDRQVAELVDRDRDDRAEVLYVVQPRW